MGSGVGSSERFTKESCQALLLCKGEIDANDDDWATQPRTHMSIKEQEQGKHNVPHWKEKEKEKVCLGIALSRLFLQPFEKLYFI